MKYITYIFITAFITASCDDMLNEDELNKLSINNAGDLEYALAGTNHQFAAAMTSNFQFLQNSDDQTSSYISSSDYNGCQIKSDVSIGGPATTILIYQPLFQTIASANDIFEKTKKFGPGDKKIQNLLGEAHLMRAYSYFWLARLFGNQFPIVDNVNVDYTLKKPTFQELYTFIEADLFKAIDLLPNNNAETRVKNVTPHRGTAKAMLAEVYLNMAGYPLKDQSMYAKAVKMAGEVIDSAAYFGYSLLPDFADLWNSKQSINNESVFTIYASGPEPDWLSYGPTRWKYPASDLFFSIPFKRSFRAALQFFNHFPTNYRKDVTYTLQRFYIYKPECITDSVNPDYSYCPPAETLSYTIDTMNLCTDMQFRKYGVNFYDTVFFSGLKASKTTGNFIYLFRFAHTLLTYAEAKARSGSLDASAIEALNQVRRRANKVAINSPSVFDLQPDLGTEQFIDSVVWERAWEFASEPEGRWFDLLRLEMIGNITKLKDKRESPGITMRPDMKTYFFPIPPSEKILNPNLE